MFKQTLKNFSRKIKKMFLCEKVVSKNVFVRLYVNHPTKFHENAVIISKCKSISTCEKITVNIVFF